MKRIIVLLFAITFVVASPVYAQEGAAEEQYDSEEEVQATDESLEQACPSARELVTFDQEGDTPEFEVTGDYLFVRSNYTNVNDNSGMGIVVFNADGRRVGFDQTDEETATYDFRYDVQPGFYYIEASLYGGRFEATAYDCTRNSSGNPDPGDDPIVVEDPEDDPVIIEGPNGEEEIIIPDKLLGKELADTGGPSPLILAGALLIGAGLLSTRIIRR